MQRGCVREGVINQEHFKMCAKSDVAQKVGALSRGKMRDTRLNQAPKCVGTRESRKRQDTTAKPALGPVVTPLPPALCVAPRPQLFQWRIIGTLSVAIWARSTATGEAIGAIRKTKHLGS